MWRVVCCALAMTAGLSGLPAAAQSENTTVIEELREVKEAVVRVADLLERRSFIDERSTLLGDIDVMDRNISFLSQERQALVLERTSIREEIASLEEKASFRPSGQLADELAEMLRPQRDAHLAEIEFKEQRVVELNRRIGELEPVIARRKAQRSALEQELEGMLDLPE